MASEPSVDARLIDIAIANLKVRDGFKKLTTSEVAVYRLLLSSKTNRQIALERFTEIKTIKFHNGNIYKKLGYRGRGQLILGEIAKAQAHAPLSRGVSVAV